MKWIIDKSFSFCYGHRVHNQRLNEAFTESGDTCLACRHLHGHEGLVKVFLAANTLTNDMVTDFKHLGWMKNFLDDTLDHKFIIDKKDPLFSDILRHYLDENDEMDNELFFYMNEGYWIPSIDYITKRLQNTPLTDDKRRALIEKYEGIVVVDFVPTSENLCAWLLKIAQEKMTPLGVEVTAVEYWETPKSHCRVEQ